MKFSLIEIIILLIILAILAIISWDFLAPEPTYGAMLPFPKTHAARIDALLDAMERIETGGVARPAQAVGDHGRSLGPLQISYAYWRDSGIPGSYADVCFRGYARRVVIAYWRRYCPAALTSGGGDLETLARVHNGGPDGPKKHATSTYWRKVAAQLTPIN